MAEESLKTNGNHEPSLEGFKGKVFKRPVIAEDHEDYTKEYEDYNTHLYQYATSSYPPKNLGPKAIIYAKQDEGHSDIKKAIEYAKETKCSIAIRSGGHQYLGFSSTGGENIQLDMETYRDWEYDEEASTLIMGPALRVEDVDEACSKAGIFVPHGECAHVAVGGHLNTGGYNPLLTPSFGLFIDFLLWFEIITADGNVRRVTKPTSTIDADVERCTTDNDDLWFAVLGGSPGNFGIVIKLKFRVLKDKDYPETRAVFHFMPATKECFYDFMTLAEEFNDNPLPLGYGFTVGAGSDGHLIRTHEMDEEMRLKHRELYGGPVELQFIRENLPAMVVFQAVWTGVNADGKQEITDEDIAKRDAWFTKIFKVAIKHKKLSTLAQRAEFAAINMLAGVGGSIGGHIHDANTPVPATAMSKLGRIMCWKFSREYDLPFQKMTMIGNTTELQKRGFAKWISEKFWEIEENSKTNGLKLAWQYQNYGGPESMMWRGKRLNPTALGHRQDNRNSFGLDYYYQNPSAAKGLGTLIPDKETTLPSQVALAWANSVYTEAIDDPESNKVGKFCESDRRYLYSPWSATNSSEINLDDEWAFYFDDKETYDRLHEIKLRLDPNHVFTPNSFSVGINDKLLKESSGKQ